MAGTIELPPPDEIFTIELGGTRAYARLAYWFDPLHWVLTDITVPFAHQGHGVGSRLLSMVIKHADDRQIDICLSIQPESGWMNYNELEAWYGRYGFVWTDGIMKRHHTKQEIA